MLTVASDQAKILEFIDAVFLFLLLNVFVITNSMSPEFIK